MENQIFSDPAELMLSELAANQVAEFNNPTPMDVLELLYKIVQRFSECEGGHGLGWEFIDKPTKGDKRHLRYKKDRVKHRIRFDFSVEGDGESDSHWNDIVIPVTNPLDFVTDPSDYK